MLLNNTEIEYLRLAAWCRDLPQNTSRYLHKETWEALCGLGYIRMSRSGNCYRPAAKALEVLQKAGFIYPQDKRTLGKGAALTRRLELAELLLFLYTAGADVFLENITQIKSDLCFLPSFAIRRAKGSNILGGTRLTGFLYASQAVFIPYYIASGKEGIYPHIEQMTFSTEYLSRKKPPVIVYTGKPNLPGLLHAVYHAEKVSFKTKASTFYEAMERLSVPVCFIPLSEDGARQLRILCIPDYRTKFAKAFLKKDGYAPAGCLWFDAINRTQNEPFLVGVDMNLKGFDRALQMAGDKKLHIAVLDFQFEPAKTYLQNKNAALYAVRTEDVEAALSLSGLPKPDFAPYQTRGGGWINVTTFRTTGTTRK